MSEKSVEELLKEADDEISKAYDCCRSAGLSKDEILEKARPLLAPIHREAFRRKICFLSVFVVICAGITPIFRSEHVQKSVLMLTRRFLFKIQPWWDWSYLYENSCLVSNPYYQPPYEEQVFDCQSCEDLSLIEHLEKTNPDEVYLDYMQYDVPVIVTDAVSDDWLASKEGFTIANITMEHAEKGETLAEDVCWFRTNLRVNGHRQLLQESNRAKSMRGWYAYWENCGKSSRKFLRKFYQRPYFLPETVSMAQSNWIFMASNYTSKMFKQVQVETDVMWFAQIKGTNYIHLRPNIDCEEICLPLEDKLNEGEIILFNPLFWSFSYLPNKDPENLAIAATGHSLAA